MKMPSFAGIFILADKLSCSDDLSMKNVYNLGARILRMPWQIADVRGLVYVYKDDMFLSLYDLNRTRRSLVYRFHS